VVVHGVTIMGPSNLPGTVPFHASQMFARNLVTLLKELTSDGALALDLENEVHTGTLLTRDGEVVNPRVRELLGLPELAPVTAGDTSEKSQAEKA
jgi:NAD(P) transhydrogenase subunit alpha